MGISDGTSNCIGDSKMKSLILMDGERILPAQTVLVRAGAVQKMGATGEVPVPHDVLIVDGEEPTPARGANFMR